MNLKAGLEVIYKKYNKRSFVEPDPLQFLYCYDDIEDREIAGVLASCLAYGRVSQIIKSVAAVLDIMGQSPFEYVISTRPEKVRRDFAGFKHRFTDSSNLIGLISALRGALLEYGSIESCFLNGFDPSHHSVIPAVEKFCLTLRSLCRCDLNFLLPLPSKGSACKRLNMFLRWMVRKDAVDPGGWSGIEKSKLIVPLDTHMFSIGRSLGFTHRKQADLRAAVEITEGFKKLSPSDPVKYDFALTRPGIRGEDSLLLKSVLGRAA